MLVPLYYTVGDRRGSALQTYLLRSLGQLFAMYLTLGLLFVPKLIYTLRGVRKGEQAEGDEDFATYGARASMTMETTERGGFSTTRMTNYTEQSASEDSDSDVGGTTMGVGDITGDSTNGRPQFVSMNITRGSTTVGDSAINSAGSAEYKR